MLEIQNLSVSVENKTILHSLNLSIKKGEIHVVMGPNGSGKSTLAKVLAGHPFFTVKEGSIVYNKENLCAYLPEERAHKGIFTSFQYPVEIPGLENLYFLFTANNTLRQKQGKSALSEEEFGKIVEDKIHLAKLPLEFIHRNINEGFSGGEKKKNEILQMLIFDPCFIILDEIDSGLDIDALKTVANAIQTFASKEKTFLLITHYQRLLDFIQPDFIHVMIDGKIVKTGDSSMAKILEKTGYSSFLSSNKKDV